MTPDTEARFWVKVHRGAPEECWPWLASGNGKGYGQFYLHGKSVLAHRFAYELVVGPIPVGLHLDHLCRMRRCVNPAHLEPVTNRENILRGVGATARNATKMHCPQGHEYTPENTRVYRDRRNCVTCLEARGRAVSLKKHALIRAARERIGMTSSQYRAAFGSSVVTARLIITNGEPR